MTEGAAGSLSREGPDRVLVLTLNHPEKKNAMDDALWVALREAFEAAGPDNDVACVLLCGAGEHFCSGVDLASFAATASEQPHPFETVAGQRLSRGGALSKTGEAR